MRILFLLLILTSGWNLTAFAQSPICMESDQTGNRVYRLVCCTNCLQDDQPALDHSVIDSSSISQNNEPLYGQIIPNPNDGHFTVTLNKSMENAWFLLFNTSGEQLITQPARGESNSFNMSELPTGNYFLVLRQADRFIAQWIVLKN